MNKKPNAILHMTGYGLVYGLLLAMIYIWGFLMFDGAGGINLAALPFTAYFAFLFGALPGAVMGFVEGWILWGMTRNVELPMRQATFVKKRNQSLSIIAMLTSLGMGSLLWRFFLSPFMEFSFTFVFVVLPALIAGGAAAYAARRYLLKLRAWGMGFEKAKNDAQHKPKHNLTSDTAHPEDSLMYHDDDQQSQMTRE